MALTQSQKNLLDWYARNGQWWGLVEYLDSMFTDTAVELVGTAPLVDAAAAFAATNPVLTTGRLGFTTDTKVTKIGDGATAWNSLPWLRVAEEPVRAEAIASQTGITTAVDITGLSVTFTVGSTPWVVEGFVPYIVAATAVVTMALNIADAANTTIRSAAQTIGASGQAAHMRVEERISTPGTYTRKLRIARTGGTGTIGILFDSAVFTAHLKAGPEK